jgi:hypothetical protein
MRVLIEMDARMCMSICVFTEFLKKDTVVTKISFSVPLYTKTGEKWRDREIY